jgi:pilus assembly protein CpaB
MRRKLVMIVAALVCGVLGTALLVNFVRGAESRALEGKQLVEVLIANSDIPSGTPVEDIVRLGLTSAIEVPAEVRPTGAIVSLDQIGGQVAATDLLTGEQLVRGRFIAVGEFDTRPSTVDVPDGMVELTIPTSADRVLGGLITPGERVMVIATFESETYDENQAFLEGAPITLPDAETEFVTVPAITHILMHKVLITEVQVDTLPLSRDDTVASGPAGPILSSSSQVILTVALTPAEAERLVFAQEFASLWFAAEGAEVPESGTSFQTRATVFEDTEPILAQ